jgi:hypothetical protein
MKSLREQGVTLGKNVTVLGAGKHGHGVGMGAAEHLAKAGFSVTVYDTNAETLAKARARNRDPRIRFASSPGLRRGDPRPQDAGDGRHRDPQGGQGPPTGAALQLLEEGWLEVAQTLELAGQHAQAAERYQALGRPALAAIAYERGERGAEARACWDLASRDARLGRAPYEEALVRFNQGHCALRLGDEAGHTHLMAAQRLLEEVADGFETSGQRERAFDCYQILLELGRRSSAFENLAEGYLNCIRILKEDNLKYYVLQYYEDFLREAFERDELHAAASLYREAAEYCLRMGLIYDRHYLRRSGETWILAAQRNEREGGPHEMSENAYLAAIDCWNTVEDYAMVRDAYARLAGLKLQERKQERYATIAARYQDARPTQNDAPPFPEALKQAHAYPEIWTMDLVEWEHDGEVAAVCLAVVGDRSYPDVVRRRGLQVLLELGDAGRDPSRLARVAEGLGELQIYVVLRPLEQLFEHPDLQVQRGVMRALRCLFFKRTFGLLQRGLRASDAGVRQHALEALARLHFNHAFDPLTRIFREHEDPQIRSIALESIGRIPSIEAGDFLIEALRHEGEPLRRVAKRLLIEFENRDLIPILRQQYQMEAGPARGDLEEILRQVGGL